MACVGLSGVGGGGGVVGSQTKDGPLCAVQTWVSAFIYLSALDPLFMSPSWVSALICLSIYLSRMRGRGRGTNASRTAACSSSPIALVRGSDSTLPRR